MKSIRAFKYILAVQSSVYIYSKSLSIYMSHDYQSSGHITCEEKKIPFGCHISDVNRTDGGLLGQFAGKLIIALKYPPSLSKRMEKEKQTNDEQHNRNSTSNSRSFHISAKTTHYFHILSNTNTPYTYLNYSTPQHFQI